MTPAAECVFCGQRAVHEHHLTGKTPARRHLDPDLTAPLCQQHHTLGHEDLRSQDLDRPRPAELWTPQLAVAFRLDRTGVFLGRLATYQDPPFYGPLAAHLRRWAGDVRKVAQP